MRLVVLVQHEIRAGNVVNVQVVVFKLEKELGKGLDRAPDVAFYLIVVDFDLRNERFLEFFEAETLIAGSKLVAAD